MSLLSDAFSSDSFQNRGKTHSKKSAKTQATVFFFLIKYLLSSVMRIEDIDFRGSKDRETQGPSKTPECPQDDN